MENKNFVGLVLILNMVDSAGQFVLFSAVDMEMVSLNLCGLIEIRGKVFCHALDS